MKTDAKMILHLNCYSWILNRQNQSIIYCSSIKMNFCTFPRKIETLNLSSCVPQYTPLSILFENLFRNVIFVPMTYSRPAFGFLLAGSSTPDKSILLAEVDGAFDVRSIAAFREFCVAGTAVSSAFGRFRIASSNLKLAIVRSHLKHNWSPFAHTWKWTSVIFTWLLHVLYLNGKFLGYLWWILTRTPIFSATNFSSYSS